MIGLCCFSTNTKQRTSKSTVAKISPNDIGGTSSNLSFGLMNHNQVNPVDGPGNPERKMIFYDSPESKIRHELNQDNRSTGVLKISMRK